MVRDDYLDQHLHGLDELLLGGVVLADDQLTLRLQQTRAVDNMMLLYTTCTYVQTLLSASGMY